MLSASHGQSRITSATSTSPVATRRLSSARASRTLFARSRASMYCGLAGAIVAVAFIWHLPVAAAWLVAAHNMLTRVVRSWRPSGRREPPASPRDLCPYPYSQALGRTPTVVQSALRSYDSPGRPVNSVATLPTLEATFLVGAGTCEEMDKSPSPSGVAGSVDAGPGKWTVLGLELALDPLEHIERPVEGGPVVGSHHARAQQRPARRHRRMQRAVREDAPVVEGPPEQRSLP